MFYWLPVAEAAIFLYDNQKGFRLKFCSNENLTLLVGEFYNRVNAVA